MTYCRRSIIAIFKSDFVLVHFVVVEQFIVVVVANVLIERRQKVFS